MERQILKNKPLLEAIFEIRWELKEISKGLKIDPHYKILIGSIYDKVKNEYPYHEQLPTSTIPEEIAGYIIQHRFRKDKDSWPLIQIGPGIITLNDTKGYVWEDFGERIHFLLQSLFESYTELGNSLVFNFIGLRYIDAVNFDFEKNDVFSFLKNNLKLKFEIDKELFNETSIKPLPSDFDFKISFPIQKPDGSLHLRFTNGKNKEIDSIIWETQVRSINEEIPKNRDFIVKWIESAHDLTDLWFFKTIEGDFIKQFE